jgi:hypothetical protein
MEAGVDVVVSAGEAVASQIKAVATSGAVGAAGGALAAVASETACERSAASLSDKELKLRAAKLLLSEGV